MGSVLEESEQTVNANATPIMSVDGPTASACMSEAEADSVPEAETVTLFAMLNGPSCPRLI